MSEYKVLTSENMFQLQNYVTDALNTGWELVGGIAIHVEHEKDNRTTIFHQAVVKGYATPQGVSSGFNI